VNPQIKKLLSLHSYKLELQYILLTFAGIFLLPAFAILVVTNTGIPSVSEQLASVNIINHKVEIHNPLNGSVIATIDADTTWPVLGLVTLEFGESDLPYQPFHTGIDIANRHGQIGDPVTPFMKGTVTYADEIDWGYGKHIIIDHGNHITSLYGHLSEIDAKVNQEVKPGDIIGKEGSTGWSTGSHVHFETRVFGIPVDPRVFLEGNP